MSVYDAAELVVEVRNIWAMQRAPEIAQALIDLTDAAEKVEAAASDEDGSTLGHALINLFDTVHRVKGTTT